jgi:hypothetical protein
MDLLYQRYASPFSFIERMIKSGGFYNFVVEFDKTIAKEKEEKQNWEFFLHKVWDGSYQDFIADVENNKKNLTMTKRTIETTVQHSMNILNNFSPDERGGEPNGIV